MRSWTMQGADYVREMMEYEKGKGGGMKFVTVDEVMSWNPCPGYSRKYIEELFKGRFAIDALDVLHMSLPSRDIFWALDRMLDPIEYRTFLAKVNTEGFYNGGHQYLLSLRSQKDKDEQIKYLENHINDLKKKISVLEVSERKSYTCGECVHPWAKQWEVYNGGYRYVCNKRTDRLQYESQTSNACPEFYMRQKGE